jgi:hypothetical protein
MPGSSARSRPAARAKAPRDLINVRFWPTLRTHGGHPRAPRSATKRHTQCSKLRLFDHLVGEREQSVRHLDAEHPGGRVVDDQLELRCLHDR